VAPSVSLSLALSAIIDHQRVCESVTERMGNEILLLNASRHSLQRPLLVRFNTASRMVLELLHYSTYTGVGQKN